MNRPPGRPATNKEISIRAFESGDYERTTRILLDGFKSKFTVLTDLDDDRLFGFLKAMNIEDSVPSEGIWVAESDGIVVGMLSLKWKGLKKSGTIPKIQYYRLVRQYGLLNVLRFILGMALLEESQAPDECYVGHIAVAAGERCLGIGSRLLDFGEAFAVDKGCKRFTLNVSAKNDKALKLYENKGFVVIRKVSSLFTHVVLKERAFFYMARILDPDEGIAPVKMRMKKNWAFGFLGLLGFTALPGIAGWFQGESSAANLLGLLWFLFFDYFIPERR